MNEVQDPERALTSALRALARDDADGVVSHGVEVRLRAEVRALGAVRRARIRGRIGVAVVMLAAAAIPVWRFAARDSRTSEAVQPAATGTIAAPLVAPQPREEITTAFLPLVYSDVPVAGAQIVRMSVPRSALASFGLTPPDGSFAQDPAASPTVVADVVVGDDGLARAVRFVRVTERPGRMEHTR